MAKAIGERRGDLGGLRRGLMLYGSTAALAAALTIAEGGIGPAWAQDIGPRVTASTAAQGDFGVPGPTPAPSFEFRSGSLDIVHMNRDAVLNWTTYDTAPPGGTHGSAYVNFLPAGTELRFVGNGQTFTAINRVFTTPDAAGAYRGIAIQGQVTSYLFGDGPGSVGPVAGNVWFFSPGGILATGGAQFNVGSLVLSASDLDDFIEFGSARQVDLSGVVDPFASVILKPGARVTLTQPNSSFAIVAPTIEQGGDVFVNGSTLYLSAEQGSLFFSSTGGISAGISRQAQPGNQIRHLGTTTGPASIGTDDFAVFDPQTVEFRTGDDVRVLLSGSIGYAPASNAALGPNGAIVLSAGSVASSGDLTLTSTTSIEAAAVDLSFGAGEQFTMGSDANGAYALSVEAAEGRLAAGAGGVVDVAGTVAFDTDGETGFLRLSAAGADAGGTPGGRIAVGGNLVLDASSGISGSSGSSQQGGRAEASIGDGGFIGVGGSLTLSGDSYAVDDEDGVTLARGGRATLDMTGEDAALSVGGALTLSAQALPFDDNCECTFPSSGSGTGGYAALTATGGSIAVGGQLSVSASAEAFESFYTSEDAVLDATGGTALVALGESRASFATISVTADAEAADSEGSTPGGAAIGGNASFAKGAGGSLASAGLLVRAEASAGDGEGYDGEDYFLARGGDAEGGTVSIALGQSAEGLGFLELSASARAGDGSDATEFSAASGGDGGNAVGGTATLTLSGEGTSLASVLEGSLNVSAEGGSGGDGEADYEGGLAAGRGGAGGSARGGSLSIVAADGAQFTPWGFPFDTSVEGGRGGDGGDQTLGEDGASTIGRGGRGGNASGASLAIIADGGQIAGDLELYATGFGGEGGEDGRNLAGGFTGRADDGVETGGSIALTARDNGTSRFDVGFAELYASGDVAGTIAIADQSSDPEASMRFDSLYAEAEGDAGGVTPAISLSSVANTVLVDGTAELYGRSVALDFIGTGQLEVVGSALVSALAGDVTISHAGNPGVLSLHARGAADIYAAENYTAGPGSVVAGDGSLLIRAAGSIAAADSRSLHAVAMFAEGDATVGDVSADGDFELFAGRLDFDGGHAYRPGARARITGTVEAGLSVRIASGGFVEFAAGSRVLSDNDIQVRSGDDIVVASGASLVSDIAPVDIESIRLLAGDINFGPESGDLIEPLSTPIASLVIGGTIATNGGTLHLSGDAIDGTGSSIATGDLHVDVTDAPPFGPFSDDAGLLTAGCHQGSTCLGSLVAEGDVAIGLDSGDGLISLRTGTITFTGDDFDAVTLERLELGAGAVSGSLVAGRRISLTSVNDAVAIGALSLEAPTLRLFAGTDLAASAAALAGLETAEIQVGNDLLAGSIFAGSGLDDGSDTGIFSVPGDFIVGSLTHFPGTPIRVRAGGGLSLGMADPSGSSIDLAAEGSLFLGSSTSSTSAIRLRGASVAFDALASTGLVDVSAGAGGISGMSATARAIDTIGSIALESAGAIAVADLLAGGDIGISGQSLSAAGLTSGGSLAVEAADAASIEAFDVGGSAVFTASSLVLGSGTAVGNLAALANEGDLSFTSLGSGRAVVLESSSAVSGDDVSAGGAVTIAGASIALDSASFGAGLALTARTGGLSGTGLYQGTGGVTLTAAQGVAIGSVDNFGGIELSAGDDARFVELRSRDGSVGVNAVGAIAGSSVAATGSDPSGDDSVALLAGGAIALDGASTALNAASGAQDDFSARADGTILVARASAGRDLSLDAGIGSVAASNLTAGRDMSLGGEAVDLAGVTVARNLAASASGGDITGSGLVTAGGAIVLDASGDVAMESLVAGTSVSAYGNSLTLADVSAGTGDVTLQARAGALTAGNVTAADLARIDAASPISLGGLVSDEAAVRSSGGAVLAAGVQVGGTLAVSGTALTVAAPGTLTVDARAMAGDIGITAGGDLTVNAAATGAIALTSTGGSVIVSSVGSSEGAGGGGIGAEAVGGGGAVSVTAANGIAVTDSISAGTALALTAGGLVSLDGAARGETIALQAGDLAIGSTGTLGDAATQRISLASANPVNLGAGASGGFAVDAAEFGRIRSGGDLLVTALAGTGSGAGSLTVGSLTVNAGSGGQIGITGAVGFTANGVLDVNNTLSIAGAGAGTTLRLTGDAVDLDYANAALSVLDGAGAATGRIVVNGRLITSISASAAADIVGRTPDEITLRLGQADVVRDIGLFRTASLTLEGRDAILIQNSGGAPFDDRRGLTVGALTVTGAPDGRTVVVLNGIIGGRTGTDAVDNLTLTTPIATGSSVNGCSLANIAACFVIPEPAPLIVAPDSILFGTGDLIDAEEDGADEVEDGVADGKTDAPPIDTTRIDDPAGLPMIDDPVTGAGNEDLWQPPEPPES